jgi:hypothetical protein
MKRDHPWLHAEMCECRCVWCGAMYVGRSRSEVITMPPEAAMVLGEIAS